MMHLNVRSTQATHADLNRVAEWEARSLGRFSDEELEAAASMDKGACSRFRTGYCSCAGSSISCHHPDETF